MMQLKSSMRAIIISAVITTSSIAKAKATAASTTTYRSDNNKENQGNIQGNFIIREIITAATRGILYIVRIFV